MNDKKKQRILLCLRFEGSGFCGWQAQKNNGSVQQAVNNALEEILGEPTGVCGCGRTDSGVHANEYYCHADIDTAFPAERLPAAANKIFRQKRQSIAVISAKIVPDDFHARYMTVSKEYVYIIQTGHYQDPFYVGRAFYYRHPLDLEKMRHAAEYLTGRHNFASFMAGNSKILPEDAVRTLKYINITEEIETCELIKIFICANGFLYNMARIIVGTLIEASEGKFVPEGIPDIIASRNRALAGRTVPAHGLYLNRVDYGDFPHII